jgi:hypothetical protein
VFEYINVTDFGLYGAKNSHWNIENLINTETIITAGGEHGLEENRLILAI